MGANRSKTVLIGLVVTAIVVVGSWWVVRGTTFGSRHDLFGGAALKPVSGRVVFVTTAHDGPTSLGTVPARGGRARSLVTGLSPGAPSALSPHGDRLAYVALDHDRPVLRILPANPDGSVRHAVGSINSSTLGNLVWSDDSTRLAFVARSQHADLSQGNTVMVSTATSHQVTDLGPRSQRQAVCVKSAAQIRCPTTVTGEPSHVRWLPHGAGLLYVIGVNPRIGAGAAPAVSEFYRVGTEGSAAATLVFRISGYVSDFVVSPAGRYLLYSQGGESESYDISGGRWKVVDLSSPTKQRVPRELKGTVQAPTWSPDGTRLLYVCDERICLAHADGREVTKVGHTWPVIDSDDIGGHVSAEMAVWSPDGQHIAWSGSPPGEGRQIFVMNVDGTGQSKILDTPDQIHGLRWVSG